MSPPLSRRRRKIAGAAFCLIAAGTVVAFWRTATAVSHDVVVHRDALPLFIERSADSLDVALSRLLDIADARTAGIMDATTPAARLHAAFRDCRTRYKMLEAVAEFYAPALAAALNSRRQEVDDDDAPPPASVAPGGFPALEALMLPTWRVADNARFREIVIGMRRVAQQLRGISTVVHTTDAQLLELTRLEIARISTVGIAGFDTPETEAAMPESADALDGLRELFAEVAPARWSTLTNETRALDASFARASTYLRTHNDFATADRLTLLVDYVNPVAHALDVIRRQSHATPIGMKRGWRATVGSVYDSGAFDARAYAADNAPSPTASLVALGERLFSEPLLSGNASRSCATCHVPSHAFTDGLVRHARVDGTGVIARHTPTLLNAALAPAQFADERAITLEEQVKRVIESPSEMGGSLDSAALLLSRSPSYVAAFRSAFDGTRNDDSTRALSVEPVSLSRIRFALAAYVRSLEAMNSRFDRAVRGDTAQMTATERRGFTLFMGKAGCGTCHFAPLFNGNTPPFYLSADVEVIGTPASLALPSVPDADSGRAAIDHLPLHYRAFKTPTVRNAARTAPFMHNGVFRSLDELLRFYDHGGGVGAGAQIANQTLSSRRLELTAIERQSLAAFIGALNDTVVPGVHRANSSAYR